MSLIIEGHLSTFYQQNNEQMFEKIIEIYILMKYYLIINKNVCSCRNGGLFMDNEDYKRMIIEIISASRDIEYLIAVYTFVKHYPDKSKKKE